MNREAIERELTGAGWRADDGFAGQLLVGNAGACSVLVPPWVWQEGVPLYELYDAEEDVACWAWGIPTPSRATFLLKEYGETKAGERDHLMVRN